MKRSVAIIGGGITGLTAAYQLERLGVEEIDLFEASPRLGGKIETHHLHDLVIEQGPDCFFARKEGVSELVEELGLEGELIAPERKEFAMLVGGELYRVPGGLVTLTHSTPGAVKEAAFLTSEGKEKALAEGLAAPGTGEDETIRSFFSRRFGAEFSRLVAEPLLAGTHGGNGDRLSMKCLYPGYFGLERKYGSLTAGMEGKPAGGGSKPSFLSFRKGMQTLVNSVAGRLGKTEIHLDRSVDNETLLQELSNRYKQVLVALPANRMGGLIPSLAPLLAGIRHESSAIATLQYPALAVHQELDYTGFLVPEGESDIISGATWSSVKWSGRSPADTVLIRVFLAGDRSRLRRAPEEQLITEARAGIEGLLGIDAPPSSATVKRWIDALPQYEIGHADKVKQIRAELEGTNIMVAGTSFDGVGVPDCVRQGRAVAYKIAERL